MINIVMWILTVLSESLIHFIFGLGILGVISGFFLSFIPFIKTYKLAIQILGVLILVLGLYLEGGLADNKEWELKVADLKVKLAEAEASSAKKNAEIEAKIVEKTKVIREKGKETIKYIDRDVIKKEEIIKYVEQCPVPKEIIDIHNEAAEMNKTAEAKK